MPRRKEKFISDFQPGAPVDDVFFLSQVETRVARTGNSYITLKLCDRTGTVNARAWQVGGELERSLRDEAFARVRGSVDRYRQRLQVTIREAEPVEPDELDQQDFLPSSYRDREELRGYLDYFLTEIYDEDYSALLESFLGDDSFMEQLCLAPGDISSHHAYLGGLLEHTVAVATLCQHAAVQHPRLDSDLLVTAAILHDIGKIEEFTYVGRIAHSREGELLGHVLIGQQMIEERIGGLESFPREKELQLLHAVISHHGELEWGAPKRPQSAEALVLHHIDNLDAKVKGFFEVVEGKGEVSWPKLQNLFRRPLSEPQAADRGSTSHEG